VAQEIETSVAVAAPAERVWEVLTAFADWPAWHPTVDRFAGTAAVGERLRFRVRVSDRGRTLTVRPTVVAVERARLLRWRVRLLVPGLLDATHEFVLQPTPAGGTRVVQRERVSGALAGMARTMIARTERDNARADAALKARVES
jgi:hypothetical protein